MKKIFVLIVLISFGFITHAAHISRVKCNNMNNSSGSANNENFRALTLINFFMGYSETFEIEMNWNGMSYIPDRVRLWIDLNDNNIEEISEYNFVSTGITATSGTKVVFNFNFNIPFNSNTNVIKQMKISMTTRSGSNYLINNSELYSIIFRKVDFPHITKNSCQSKTINDPNPDFLVNFSLDSKTDPKVSFNYVKGTILPGLLSVKRENIGVVPKKVRVYIDFDKNGTYSNLEKIYDREIPVWPNNIFNSSEVYEIIVPTSKSVTLNSAYKLKVEVVGANGAGEGHVYSLFFKSSYARTSEESQSDVEQTNNSSQYEENVDDVLIYPNPANDNFSVKYFSNENYEININLISETGQSRFQKDYNVFKGNNIINISTESLPKGVYIVEIIGNNGVKVHKKMVIQ